jgi:hypothetical protein
MGTSRGCTSVDPEVRVTEPRHGASRAEVSDLRNIVDRLDLLMGGPGTSSRRGGGRSTRDEAIVALGERIEALEGEVDELRTLVNHLMTIATWQAKVTATLVDDRAGEDDGDDVDVDVTEDERMPDRRPQARGDSEAHGHDRHAGRDGIRAAQRHAPHATALDDDIDDILGGDRSGPHHDPPPPDFGI